MDNPSDNDQTWPPAPTLVYPVAKHDALLAELVQELTAAGLPVTKIQLVKGLNKRAGLELRECLPLVQDFVDRECPQIATRAKRSGWFAVVSLVIYCFCVIAVLTTPSYLRAKFRHMPRAQLLLWHSNAETALHLLTTIAMVLGILCIYLICRHGSRCRHFKW